MKRALKALADFAVVIAATAIMVITVPNITYSHPELWTVPLEYLMGGSVILLVPIMVYVTAQAIGYHRHWPFWGFVVFFLFWNILPFLTQVPEESQGGPSNTFQFGWLERTVMSTLALILFTIATLPWEKFHPGRKNPRLQIPKDL